MMLTELFAASPKLTKMTDAEIKLTRLSDVAIAWKFKVNDTQYMVLFDQCAGVPDEYSCGFVRYTDDKDQQNTGRRVTYQEPSDKHNKEDVFQVLSAVLKAFKIFLAKFKPNLVAMNGTSPHRQKLYSKIADKLSPSLRGYHIEKDRDGNMRLLKDNHENR